ncbi:MAG: DegT/DnrJ/EryC1/StrS family aminotransferase [Candidatus Eisenbacteria bacterium]|nr:DegT/DnrJ/EryC1/StrS family aminotransferase [Candidatus Eisenbacteria bacterium]
MNIPLVDLQAQYGSIKNEIDGVMAEVILKSAFVGGPYVKSFEKAFAQSCGVRHCIGVGSGTDALFITLKALGIGEGDEVITAANTFIATSEAVTQAGARVVFVDADPKTYNIDTGKIEQKITPRTKAVIPVHLYGQPADMDPILELARRRGLRVIEDAAQAHAAVYKGRQVGSFGDAACFSFYPGKNLGAYGDGGAIVTNSDELALKVRMFANHGRVDKYDHEVEGVNSRLDGLQAAILGVKLRHLPEWTEKRRKNARLYGELLKGADVVTPVQIRDVKAVYHLYVIRVNGSRRKQLQEHLKSKGVATGIHYPIALPNLKAYAYLKHSETDFPEATKASHEVLSLPMYPELDDSQVQYVAASIKEFL